MQSKPQGPPPDITVTTATQTEAQVRENLGVPAEPVADVKPEPVVKAEEAEADSPKPDAEVSEAARKLRSSRSDERKAKIQREIDDAVKEREAVRGEAARERAEVARLKKEREGLASPPAEKPGDVTAQPAAVAGPAAPKFDFPIYADWLAKNPTLDYDDYQDARTDARYAFNRHVERETEQRDRWMAERRRISEENTAHAAKFKEAHPDYEEKLTAVQMPMRQKEDGTFEPWPVAMDLNELIMESGADGPAILYHLANHPAKVDALMNSPDKTKLALAFGKILSIVESERNAAPVSAVPVAPAAPLALVPPPPKPVTDAPAPVSQTPGSAQSTRSLAQLAASTDDADAYIAERKRQQRAG